MKQEKIDYLVYLGNRETYTTRAVSELQAINNIHYILWFEHGIWTEMEDFTAEPEVIARFRRYRDDERRDQGKDEYAGCHIGDISHSDQEQYVQMSLP